MPSLRASRPPAIRWLATLFSLLALVVALIPAVVHADTACQPNTVVTSERRAESCGLELIGGIDLGDGGAGQIAVHDDLAAVVRRDEGIVTLVDLTDPTAPQTLGSYDGGTGNDTLDQPLDGDVAFTDDGAFLLHARQTSDYSNEGLHVLDVTDPAAPVLTDFAPQGGMLRVGYARLDVGEVVVTLDAISGMTIFRLVRTPLGARVVPVHVDPLPALKVGGPASAGIQILPDDPVFDRDTLYVTDGKTGLRVLDLTDPTDPATLATWSERGLAAVALQPEGDRVVVHAASEYWFKPSTFPLLHTLTVQRDGTVSETDIRIFGPFDGSRAWKLGGLDLHDGELYVAHGHAGLLALDLAEDAVTRATTDLGASGPARADLGNGAWHAMDVVALDDHVLVSDAATGHLQVFRRVAG